MNIKSSFPVLAGDIVWFREFPRRGIASTRRLIGVVLEECPVRDSITAVFADGEGFCVGDLHGDLMGERYSDRR